MNNLYKAVYVFTKEVNSETKTQMIDDWWTMRKPWVKIVNYIIPIANRIANKMHLSERIYEKYILSIYKPVSFIVNLYYSSKTISECFGGEELDFYVRLKTDEDVIMHAEFVKI